MKYKICIKYPSGYRYRKVVEVDGEEAAQTVAHRLLDRCNSDFNNLPACKIESIESVIPIDEKIQEIEERAHAPASSDKAALLIQLEQSQKDSLFLLAEVKRLRDKLDYMDEYALDTLKTQLKQERERAEEAEKERDAAIKDMTDIAINCTGLRKCLKCVHVNGSACTRGGECCFKWRGR